MTTIGKIIKKVFALRNLKIAKKDIEIIEARFRAAYKLRKKRNTGEELTLLKNEIKTYLGKKNKNAPT